MCNEKFTIFVNSQLHGAVWPKEACAVVSKDVFGRETPFVARNNFHGTHAEQELIEELKQHLKENRDVLPTERPVSLKLFLNYSPCYDCSFRLCRFIDDCKSTYDLEISLEVVFSGIYKIARPSCKRGECGESHKKLSHVEENITGLKFLTENGAKLRTFEERDWRELASILELSEEFATAAIENRKNEDIRMRQDLQELLLGSER